MAERNSRKKKSSGLKGGENPTEGACQKKKGKKVHRGRKKKDLPYYKKKATRQGFSRGSRTIEKRNDKRKKNRKEMIKFRG